LHSVDAVLEPKYRPVLLQAMVDLVWMMNKLVDEEGNILVEGIMDSVAPVTPEEEAKYHNIGRRTLSFSLLLSRG
jgi:hypothetical protein